ncbi:MAG: cytochrome c4 [Nitrosomonadales bacterium]|nr:cytochrome c4 [Nitrosomonadales bacterium]
MKDKNTRISLCAMGALIGMLAMPAVQADPAPLEERLQLCGGCHNPDGNSVIAENPKLAGLNAKYLQRQLEDFKAGKRKNAIMDSIIPMVEESEFKALAKYFSEQKRLPGSLAVVEPVAADPSAPAAAGALSEQAKAELIAKGQQIYMEGVMASAVPACGGCHGEDGTGNDKFPYIGSQNNVYVVNQLTNFKTGARDNDPKGVMRAVAKRMTDEEITAVAEFIQTLKEAQ